jgi:aryl-alcohol dehydrogenase-like predicted oxidoreductase
MKTLQLGRSGLRVSEACLGTMTFGEEWGFGADESECRGIFDAYVEAGGNFIDTANLYTSGTSERLVGRFVAGDRQRFVIGTKYTCSTDSTNPNASGNHRKHLVESVEGSLQRLGTDYVDILWVHAWEQVTPVDEVMRALDDLVRQGKVLYVGVSNTPAWVVAQANTLAQCKDWSPFVAMQIEYSLTQRVGERDLLPMAKALGIGVMGWSPLAGGLLTGKHSQPGPDTLREAWVATRKSDKNLAIADLVVSAAAELGCTPAQLALSWVKRQGVIPILGARRQAQMVDNLAGLSLELPDEVMDSLHRASRIRLGYPHSFLKSKPIQKLLYGARFRP